MYVLGYIVLLLTVMVLMTWYESTQPGGVEHLLGPSFKSQMADGTIQRTPLLAPGQSMADIRGGWNRVTGGYLFVEHISAITHRISEIRVDNPQGYIANAYVPGRQPYNFNYACVLYEIRAAGWNYITPSTFGTKDHTDFIYSFQLAHGLHPTKVGFLTISDLALERLCK